MLKLFDLLTHLRKFKLQLTAERHLLSILTSQAIQLFLEGGKAVMTDVQTIVLQENILDLLAKNNTISVNNGGKFKYCELQYYLKIFAYVIVSSSVISFHGDSSTADTLRWNFVIGIDTISHPVILPFVMLHLFIVRIRHFVVLVSVVKRDCWVLWREIVGCSEFYLNSARL